MKSSTNRSDTDNIQMKQPVTQAALKRDYIHCLYSAMSSIHKALRHGSHSFTCKLQI